jgi:hypothetical protein
VTGECEEDVIEVWGVNCQALDRKRFSIELVEHGPQGPNAAVARYLQRQLGGVALQHAERAGRPFKPGLVSELQADVSAGDQTLELVRGAFSHYRPVVEDCDPVGDLVRLL